MYFGYFYFFVTSIIVHIYILMLWFDSMKPLMWFGFDNSVKAFVLSSSPTIEYYYIESVSFHDL